MAVRNVLLSLPRVLGIEIMAEWISTIDLSAMDCAMSNRTIRPVYVETLSHEYFSTYGIDSFMKYKYLCWIFFRKMKVKVLKVTGLMTSDLFMLVDIIESYSRIHTFHISNCFDVAEDVLDSAVLKLAKYHRKTLQSIGFRNCPVVSEPSVIKLIESCPSLTSYDMSNTSSLTSSGLLMLTACCRGMKEVNLSNCSHLISSNAANVLMQLAETYASTLETLDLMSNSFVNSAVVCSIVVKSTHLQYLNISHCNGIDDSTVLTIAACCTSLQLLGLAYCIQVTDLGMNAIANSCPDLTSLDISNCTSISSDSLQEIAQRCFDLRCLYVSECSKITDIVLINIAENCNEMSVLNLTYCHRVSDAAVMGIAKCCPQLQSLILSFCYKVSDVSVITVTDKCPHLRTMDLTCCERITDNSIIYLVEECSTLTSLHLGGCVLLTDASIMAIAVCCGSSLRLLDCSDNSNYTDIAVLKLVACCCALKPSAFGKSSFYLKNGFEEGGIASDIRDSISSAGHYIATGRLSTLIMSYCTGVSRDAINYISMTYTKLDLQAAISRNCSREREYSEDIEEYC